MIGDGGENDKSEGDEVGRSQIDQGCSHLLSESFVSSWYPEENPVGPGGIEMRKRSLGGIQPSLFHGCLAYKSYKVQNGDFFPSLINI